MKTTTMKEEELSSLQIHLQTHPHSYQCQVHGGNVRKFTVPTFIFALSLQQLCMWSRTKATTELVIVGAEIAVAKSAKHM